MSFLSPGFRAYGMSLLAEEKMNDILGIQFQNPNQIFPQQKLPQISKVENEKPIIENEESKENEKKINNIDIPDATIFNIWDEPVSEEDEFDSGNTEGGEHIGGDTENSKFNPKRTNEPKSQDKDPRPEEFEEVKVTSEKPDTIANATRNQSQARPFVDEARNPKRTPTFKLSSSKDISAIKTSIRNRTKTKKNSKRNKTGNDIEVVEI